MKIEVINNKLVISSSSQDEFIELTKLSENLSFGDLDVLQRCFSIRYENKYEGYGKNELKELVEVGETVQDYGFSVDDLDKLAKVMESDSMDELIERIKLSKAVEK